MFAAMQYAQSEMLRVFEALPCDKIRIDTSGEEWDAYVRQLTQAVGFAYQPEATNLPHVGKYCGTYRRENGELWDIGFDQQTGLLYTRLFWPYMPMQYKGNDCFELISFPVSLQFDLSGDCASFAVSGNYDWNHNGQVFRRTE